MRRARRHVLNIMSFIRGVPIICLLLAGSSIKADDVKPCLIFSNDEAESLAVDLEKYNRVSFGPESMILSNSNDPEAVSELLYSEYKRLHVDYANPSVAIEEVEVSAFEFQYNKELQALTFTSDSEESVHLGVFNISGSLILQRQLHSGEELSVKKLAPGAYVAIAAGKSGSKSIKFVK